MLTTEVPKKITPEEAAQRREKLKEKADRFTTQRAFETVRERHGLPKPKSPK